MSQRSPEEVLQLLLAKDAFSQWMGLRNISVGLGHCKFEYVIIPEMLNGLGTVHGGILFSAADSALAFAANSHDILSVALEVAISFTTAARLGDILTVVADEVYAGRRTAVYDIKTHNQNGALVCIFKGTVYRTDKQIKPLEA